MINELEDMLIDLIDRVNNFEKDDKKRTSNNMFVVGEIVQYCSKPVQETFDKMDTILSVTKECVLLKEKKYV
eukprot:9725750-Ditylum_brightwellii.AAC.1